MSTFNILFILVLFSNITLLLVCLTHTLKCVIQSWENNEHFKYDKGKNIWTLLNPNIGIGLVVVTFSLNIILLKSFNYQTPMFFSNYCDYTLIFIVMIISYLLVHITSAKTTYGGYAFICTVCALMLAVVLFVGNIVTFLKAYPNV